MLTGDPLPCEMALSPAADAGDTEERGEQGMHERRERRTGTAFLCDARGLRVLASLLEIALLLARSTQEPDEPHFLPCVPRMPA